MEIFRCPSFLARLTSSVGFEGIGTTLLLEMSPRDGNEMNGSAPRTPEEWQEAAASGDAAAQTRIALLYAEGEGVPRSYELAVEWFRKAAEQGHFDAQYNLGYMFDNGHGVEQNYAQAAYWYGKAAEQGDQHAQNNLGDMYDVGQGVPQDHVEAARWYRKAAEKGDGYAQHRLGEIFERFERDVKQAYAWYRLVASLSCWASMSKATLLAS